MSDKKFQALELCIKVIQMVDRMLTGGRKKRMLVASVMALAVLVFVVLLSRSGRELPEAALVADSAEAPPEPAAPAIALEIPAAALLSRALPAPTEKSPEIAPSAPPEAPGGGDFAPPPPDRPARIYIPYVRPSALLSKPDPDSEAVLSTATRAAPKEAAPIGASPRRTDHEPYINVSAMLSPSVRLSTEAADGWRASAIPSASGTPAATASYDPETVARALYFVRQADAWTQAGRDGDALRAYTNALALFPRLQVAHHQLGRLWLRQGAYERAIHHLTAALDATEDLGDVLNDQGIAFLYAGQAARALEVFFLALGLDEGAVAPRFNAGLALRNLERADEAREYLEQALEIEPDNARVYRELAALDWQAGRREEAMTRLRRAEELEPGWDVPVLDAALWHAEAGEVEAAIARLDAALELAPARVVVQVYQQAAFRDIRLSPAGAPFEARLAARARAEP